LPAMNNNLIHNSAHEMLKAYKEYVLMLMYWPVYDGKRNFGSYSHSYWCDEVFVIQSCWWKLCLQQREGNVSSLDSTILLLPCGSSLCWISHKWLLYSNYIALLHFHQIHKVPATDMEALKSPLMGLFEKRRARNFFVYVQNYNEADPVTHQGLDLTRITTRELITWVSCSFSHHSFYQHCTLLINQVSTFFHFCSLMFPCLPCYVF
jgi:hypothetical protein